MTLLRQPREVVVGDRREVEAGLLSSLGVPDQHTRAWLDKCTDVRLGSDAEVTCSSRHVRFPLKADTPSCPGNVRFVQMKTFDRHHRRPTFRSLQHHHGALT
jgi:hypothetical protein